MRKGQQQIRCNSDVSIAGRTDNRLQVKSVFIPVLSHTPAPLSLTSLSMSSCTHRLMDFWSCVLTPTLVFFPWPHTAKASLKQLLMSFVCVVSETGSSSSEDEAPKRATGGSGARNGEVRRRRSRTQSPRRRHRDPSPRSDNTVFTHYLTFIISL